MSKSMKCKPALLFFISASLLILLMGCGESDANGTSTSSNTTSTSIDTSPTTSSTDIITGSIDDSNTTSTDDTNTTGTDDINTTSSNTNTTSSDTNTTSSDTNTTSSDTNTTGTDDTNTTSSDTNTTGTDDTNTTGSDDTNTTASESDDTNTTGTDDTNTTGADDTNTTGADDTNTTGTDDTNTTGSDDTNTTGADDTNTTGTDDTNTTGTDDTNTTGSDDTNTTASESDDTNTTGTDDTNTTGADDTNTTGTTDTNASNNADDSNTTSTDDTVIEINLESITLNHQELIIAAGESIQLTATANYSDASSADVLENILWESSDITLAKISNTGLITGLFDGEVTIIAFLDGIEAKVNVTVTESPAAALIGEIGGTFLDRFSGDDSQETTLIAIANEALTDIAIPDLGHTVETKASGIAHLCSKLLEEVEIDPSLTETDPLLIYYDYFLKKITSLTSTSELEFTPDLTNPMASVRYAQISRTARDPSIAENLADIADNCISEMHDISIVAPSNDAIEETSNITVNRGAEAIGTVAGGFVLALTRDPSQEETLVAILNDALAQIESTTQNYTLESKANGIAFFCSSLLEGVARQPEIRDTLSTYQDSLLQRMTPSASISEPESLYDLTYQAAMIREAQFTFTARQPEVAGSLKEIADACISAMLLSDNMTDEQQTVNSRALEALGLMAGGVIESVARQPEIAATLDTMSTEAIAQIESIAKGTLTLESKAEGIAHMCSKFLEAVAKEPLRTDELTAYYGNIIEKMNALVSESVTEYIPDFTVQIATVQQTNIFYTAREPEEADTLAQLSDNCIVAINDLGSSNAQNNLEESVYSRALEAKGIIGSGVLNTLSRYSSLEDSIIEMATNALAQIETENNNHTIESRANGITSLCMTLIDETARSPSLLELLTRYHDNFLIGIVTFEIANNDTSAFDLSEQIAMVRIEQMSNTSSQAEENASLQEIANTCISLLQGDDFTLEEVEEVEEI
ncbi:hypothetical protein [uncultured Shewanella sp.]|uniref:hypothetical protein n=1 Tax=uncultured Shewanella sp. TaxID=173975 RepID=UPI002610F167|nr:hypothetical protein [uncultured Shewanella sp.]